ncbi:chemotaxis protein methyltransferase CheR [Archangium gephyra]|uniref:Chemotaxis protein methyltransferase CheR n=1 Tax=Archangium gephyra TaxID=48 RepID=A0AAC8QDD2_9BACT|nr:CheR family methyltransferase [Archangium gephyra]AKJ05444.1 Chemotaxis protein methyltransferase CheR [Archangium gephyra]REG36127.1 chemotaxis protein methyltransferase CheR [Archangium gephyra]
MKDTVRVERLDEATLSGLESVLRIACGMVLAPSVRPSLGTALTRAAESQGLPTADFLQRLLARDTAAVEAFIGYAVIGETYFFRHPEQLRELARMAPAHAGPFLVWSAGCASGEEPYSIAMTLLAAGLPSESIRVVGTDVSGRALERARQATYSPWSVRRMEPELERRFLTIRPESVSVPPEVRARVEFRRHNLVTDPPPVSGAQAVFCRNVLIYFPPEVIPGVLERLVRALAPGGWLFLAPAEVPFAKGMGLEEREVEGLPVLCKPVPGERPVPRAARSAPLRVLAPRAPTSPLRRVQTPSRATPASEAPAPAAAPVAQAIRAGQAVTPPPTPQPPTGAPVADSLEQALAAAREGRFDVAEEFARLAARELSPEAYLLLAMVAEGREDVQGAVAAVRKALYLEPQLAIGHAMLVALYGRLGQPEEAERARRNALRALEGLDDEHVLRGVEAMTAGGLRRALVPGVRMGKSGAR